MPVLDPTSDVRCRILLVDARPERRSLMRLVAESGAHAGVVVAEAGTVEEGVAALARHTVDAAVIEIQDAGHEVITALRAEQPALRIVVCTFATDGATRQRALDGGADAFLAKPVSARALQSACGG